MAAELTDDALRDALPGYPRAWLYRYSDPISGAPCWRHDDRPWNGQQAQEAEALYDFSQVRAAILALLPSPGEYAGLIEEAKLAAKDLVAIASLIGASPAFAAAATIDRLADALSSALRERDKWKADYVAVQKVNADWSAYDKGLREAGKALVDFCDDPNGSESDETLACGLARLLPSLRSALSLVVGEEDHG